MEKELKKPWYKKKRYIASLVGASLVLIGANSHSTPQQQISLPQVVEVSPQDSIKTANSVNTQSQATPLSNDNYYTNIDGNQVHSPAYAPSVPQGASAQCRDGTYSFSRHHSGTCSHHGGVEQWF